MGAFRRSGHRGPRVDRRRGNHRVADRERRIIDASVIGLQLAGCQRHIERPPYRHGARAVSHAIAARRGSGDCRGQGRIDHPE